MGKGIKNACVRKMGVGPLASNLTTHDTLNLSRTIDSFTWVVRTFPVSEARNLVRTTTGCVPLYYAH